MSNPKKTVTILLAIILFGSALRLWSLGKIPEGFYSDEALYGYEAYSLLKTGKDQFGNPWPVSIAGFGDYRPALYIYLTMPFVATLGLTEYAVRLPSAVFSIFTIPVVYLFVYEVLRNRKTALISSLLFALSAQSVYLSRMAHETNLMTLLVLLGVYFLWKSKTRPTFLILASILLAISFYVYHSARVFVPLFFVGSLFLYPTIVKKNIQIFLISMLAGLVVCTPLIMELRSPDSWSRVSSIGIWNDQGTILSINEFRGQLDARGVSSAYSRLIANKVTAYPVVFVKNWLSHFSPSFLLFSGDANGIYNTPRNGVLGWVEVMAVFGGLIIILKRKRKIGLWILMAIVISLVPDSLTKVAPSSPRIHLWLPYVVLAGGIFWRELGRRHTIIYWCVAVFLIGQSMWFWHNYLVVRPLKHADAWQMGTKEMILSAENIASNYEKIWISRSGWGWIHILFHTRYDPFKFQKEAVRSTRNEHGFWWVSDVGKYHLEWLPELNRYNVSTLYIGKSSEFNNSYKPFYVIRDKWGNEQFWFVNKMKNVAN